MTDLQIFTFVCKKQLNRSHDETYFPTTYIGHNEKETLPWHLHAQIYGLHENKEDYGQTSPPAQRATKSKDKALSSLRSPSTDNIPLQSISYSNLNKYNCSHVLRNQVIHKNGIFETYVPNGTEQVSAEGSSRCLDTGARNHLVGLMNEKYTAKVRHSFENFQNSYNSTTQFECAPRIEITKGTHLPTVGCTLSDLANAGQYSCKTETFHSLDNSNVIVREHGKHSLSHKILTPIPSENTYLIPSPTACSATKTESVEIMDLYDPCRNVPAKLSAPMNLSASFDASKLEFSRKNEVNILFLTKLFRQIHNLPTASLRHSAFKNYLKPKRVECYKHLKRNCLAPITPNSLVSQGNHNLFKLNTNDVNFEPSGSLIHPSHKFRKHLQFGQFVSQSNQYTDVHRIRKWHSGMLKVKRKRL